MIRPPYTTVIFDHLDPESTAMLMALHSRNSDGVSAHLKRIEDDGSTEFMSKHYAGYNHKSIGDCGVTALSLEGISILAIKALQDSPLFRGQETSTRYIDMAKQPIVDPVGTAQSAKVLGLLMDFYKNSSAPLIEDLRRRYPQKETDRPKTYERAIAAKSFDILRGFLPAGITSLVAWSTDLRQAYDQLQLMRHHPLKEVRLISEEVLRELKGKYPGSFSQKIYPETEDYISLCMQDHFLETDSQEDPEQVIVSSLLKTHMIDANQKILHARKNHMELPRRFAQFGNVDLEFTLDYGSWRDIDRHRNGSGSVSLLTQDIGFHSWYLEQLTPTLRLLAEELLARVKDLTSQIEVEPAELQYLLPMGYRVRVSRTSGLPGLVYMLELRSTKFIHPTLRSLIHRIADMFEAMHPNIPIFIDRTESDWDVRRGDQTIHKRE